MKYPIDINSDKHHHNKNCCTHYGLVTSDKGIHYNIFTCTKNPDMIIAMRDEWEHMSLAKISSNLTDPVWKKGLALIKAYQKPKKIKWRPLDIEEHSVKVLSKRKIRRLYDKKGLKNFRSFGYGQTRGSPNGHRIKMGRN